jgi:hypothetical protein
MICERRGQGGCKEHMFLEQGPSALGVMYKAQCRPNVALPAIKQPADFHQLPAFHVRHSSYATCYDGHACTAAVSLVS